MSIEISEHATNKLSALIGTSDPAAIAQLIEKLADNAHFVRSLLGSPTREDVLYIQHALDELNAGRTRPFAEFDAEFRQEMGFQSRPDR